MGITNIAKDMSDVFMKQKGERVSKEFIKFNKNFVGVPQVIVGLSGLDAIKQQNIRV
jgi:hypothetical protein